MSNNTILLNENQSYFDHWRDLSPMDNAILRVIETQGGEIRQAEIVALLGISDVSSVSRSITKLSQFGILVVTKSGRTNRYRSIFLAQTVEQQLTTPINSCPPINNKIHNSNNRKIEPKVFEDLECLGILDLPQRSAYARKITKGRTPKKWLMAYDPDGAIAGRVSAWAEFKRNGGLIDVDPIPLWLNILKGDAPPEKPHDSHDFEPVPDLYQPVPVFDHSEPQTPPEPKNDGDSRLRTLTSHHQFGGLFVGCQIVGDLVRLSERGQSQYQVKRGRWMVSPDDFLADLGLQLEQTFLR